MKVHEIMTGHPRSVAPDSTLVEVAGLMRELDVGALPVVDGDVLAGMVTDRDIVVRGIADGQDPAKAQARDVMSGGIESVSPEQDVEDAARIMEQHQIRRLPVLDNAKRLIGMVSLGDIATSSNPAFGGMALRDVSQPNEATARRRRPGGGMRGRTGAQSSRGGGMSRVASRGASESRGAKSRRSTSRTAKTPAKRGKAKKK